MGARNDSRGGQMTIIGIAILLIGIGGLINGVTTIIMSEKIARLNNRIEKLEK